MARLRYVRNPQQARAAQDKNPEFSMNNTVRSLRALYRTDEAIAHALLPKPLLPSEPNIFVQFANVCMHIPNAEPVTISAATVGVECIHEGVKGYYVLAMPMEGEFVVIGGRETYGEPKKIANVDFNIEGDQFHVSVIRHGIPFLQMKGRLGESTGAASFTEFLYCHKAFPSIQKNGGFDGDVFLTQLEWKRNYTDTRAAEGEIVLVESPYDPLIDVPVRQILSMQYAEGNTNTSGKILRSIPGDWLAPFIHQRYDDVETVGIDVQVA
jgi:acetoacetate decarboxylase